MCTLFSVQWYGLVSKLQLEQEVVCYLSRCLRGYSMAGSKTKLFRPHEASRRWLACHYGDGFGKHLLSAVGWRLTSCMRLIEVACHPANQKSTMTAFGSGDRIHKPILFNMWSNNDLFGYSQLVRHPQCRPLLAWRMRASQSLVNVKRDDLGFPAYFLWIIFYTQLMSTSVELVYDSLKPFLKGDGIGRALECKAKLSILYSPVMEDGVHLVVH